MIDLKKARLDTPACEKIIHFNNAGASLMPRPVVETVQDFFDLEITIGGYEASEQKAFEIEDAYRSAASLIGASPQEIAFTENATRAWDMVFYALPFSSGDKIITVQAEYASNYIAFLHIAKKKAIEIIVIPDDEYGQVDLKELENSIDSKVKLIAITHVPTQGGLINPAQAIGKIAKRYGIFYLLDATQSVGQMPINVQEIGCDALCATGRKYLRGPRGTGFLYVNKNKIETLEPPLLDLHAAIWTSRNEFSIQEDAKRFETWEKNYGNLLGLKAAIDYAMSWGLDNIFAQITELATYFRRKLQQIPGTCVRDLGQNQCGIVTFTIEGKDPYFVKEELNKQSINVSVSLCEYARLDMERRGIKSLVRASVHYYNTMQEIDRFIEALLKVSLH